MDAVTRFTVLGPVGAWQGSTELRLGSPQQRAVLAALLVREGAQASISELTYDHVKPRRDLERWLKYVGMSEEEFDHTCDTFRDPRVWRTESGQWVKDTIWGEREAFGPVCLPDQSTTNSLERA